MISRSLVEDTPRLGIADVRSVLAEGVDEAVLELDLDVDGQRLVQKVVLTATPLPQPGAQRWWWKCPRCGQRRGHLYLVGDVLCRRCALVGYASQYSA